MTNIEKFGVRYLILQLLERGSGGFSPDIEPIPVQDIVGALEILTAESFGDDVEAWMAWFIDTDSTGTEEERRYMYKFLKMYRAEKRLRERD